jgi:hypothetical protein
MREQRAKTASDDLHQNVSKYHPFRSPLIIVTKVTAGLKWSARDGYEDSDDHYQTDLTNENDQRTRKPRFESSDPTTKLRRSASACLWRRTVGSNPTLSAMPHLFTRIFRPF